jgi:tRNA nucleotidyltransferase (CCA-adding enzyme)
MTLVPLETVLQPSDLALLRTLGAAADAAGAQLWLVGGAVRDAMLGRRVADLDVTSEMAATELAPVLAAAAGGVSGTPTRFGTVKLRVRGRTLDLATARRESYRRPGALPEVSPADIQADLARRDLPINAMAASLAPRTFGELLDPLGGAVGLAQRTICVLHERSFRDDATRILRVVRYATRLGFRIERRSARWLRRDLGYLQSISPARIHREIVRTAEEETGARALLQALRLGVLDALDGAIDRPQTRYALSRASRQTLPSSALIAVMLYALPPGTRGRAVRRIGLTRRQASFVTLCRRLRDAEGRMADLQGSALFSLASETGVEAAAVGAVASVSPVVRAKLAWYVRRARAMHPLLDGNDLLDLGVPQGPLVGVVLETVRSAVVDGKVRSRAGALGYVKALFSEASD